MEKTNSMKLLERARRIMKEQELNPIDSIIKAEEELKKEYEEKQRTYNESI